MNNREEIISEVESREHTYIRVLAVFKSPISGNLEYRVAYFTSTMEASVWEKRIKEELMSVGTEFDILKNIVTGRIEDK